MKPVRVAAAAAGELEAAGEWYEGKRAGLGMSLVSEVDSALELIQRSPGAGSLVSKLGQGLEVRRVPLRRFPYFVIYRERDTEIQIIAFAHTSRRPGYWRSRSN